MISSIKSTFSKKMADATACHGELMLAIHNKKNEKTLQTMLVEQFIMLSVVSWEGYLNDLFIAYAQKRPATAIECLERKIQQSIVSKFGEKAAGCVNFSVRKPITHQRMAGFLDPRNFNITARSSQELSNKANEFLHATFAKRFSLDKADSQFIDYAIAMRNYLSHRSRSSYDMLKASIAKLSEAPNQHFVGDIRNIGTYLKQQTVGGKTRAVEFSERLSAVAIKL